MSLYDQRNQNIITLENLTRLYFVPCSSPEYLSAHAGICSWDCWGPFRKEMKPQKGTKNLKVLREFRSEICVVTMTQGLMYIHPFTAALSTCETWYYLYLTIFPSKCFLKVYYPLICYYSHPSPGLKERKAGSSC